MNSLMDLGGGVGWIGTLLIGGVAGWIAEKVMKTDQGIIMNIIVGVIGSYIGTVLARMLSINVGQIVDQWFVSQGPRHWRQLHQWAALGIRDSCVGRELSRSGRGDPRDPCRA